MTIHHSISLRDQVSGRHCFSPDPAAPPSCLASHLPSYIFTVFVCVCVVFTLLSRERAFRKHSSLQGRGERQGSG